MTIRGKLPVSTTADFDRNKQTANCFADITVVRRAMKRTVIVNWKIVTLAEAPVYVIWQEKSDIDLLYAPFHQRVMSLKPFLRQCSESTIHAHLAEFAALGKPVFTLADIQARQASPQFATVHLSIGISNNCTLSCQYCHADAGLGNKVIDTVTLRSAIDAAFATARQNRNKEILVTFSAGGEPTFHWKKFTDAVLYIRRRERESSIKTGIQMTTNGYYSDRKREFIVKSLNQVTLSLDGIRSVQDKQRPSSKGHDTFDQVVATAKYFYARQFPFGFRSTVTKDSSHQLCEFVRFVADEIGKVPIAFETVVPVGRAAPKMGKDNNVLFALDLAAVTDSLWAAFLTGESLGIPVSTSSINLKKIVPRMCGAMALPSLTVTSDGKITGCHRDNAGIYSYGAIDSTGTVKLDKNKVRALQRLSEAPVHCETCFCRYSCGGDCPDLRMNNLDRCSQTRLLTFRALHEKIKLASPLH